MDQNFNGQYTGQNGQFGGQMNNQFGGQVNNPYGGQMMNNQYTGQTAANPYGGQVINNQYAAQNYNPQFSGQNYNNGYYGQNDPNAFGMNQPYSGFGNGGGFISNTMGELMEAMQQKVVNKAFLYMVAALGVTAVAAFWAPNAMANFLASSPSSLFILIALELAVVIVSNIAIRKNNAPLTVILFTIYSFLTGATLGVVFWAYELSSVGSIFLMTAVIFGVMAVYGLVTKKDLSSIGSILMMGLIGIIIATIVNAFILHSAALDMIVSFIGIAIFVGLTAFDTQKIKKNVAMSDGDNLEVLALSGAFELYLDFINIFIRLLRIMGRRK
ncbi:MAG: Bax inhibitor-1/YccA family protein [Lachnospiraceae bacterium]|nr:Bax inhibitor-1/YccA family protein [Lachnospiraceae bacterium]